MVDLRKVVIEIKQVNQDGTPNPAPSPDVQGDTYNITNTTNISYILHPVQSLQKATIGRNVLVNQAFELAKSAITSAVSLSVSRYFTMKEDYMAETSLNNTMSALSKVASFGTSVAGGAVVGAQAGGAIGAGIGAAIAAVGWGITEGINAVGAYNNQMKSLQTSVYQSGFMQARYGLVNGGRGTEN